MTESTVYDYAPHPRTEEKLHHLAEPVPTAEVAVQGRGLVRFNNWLGVKVTNGVGTMWCAYAFCALALISLPAAVRAHSAVVLVSWISQTFLQLVLLSVVLVGQNVLATAADRRAEATSHDADAVLHEAVKIQEHLAAQDRLLQALAGPAAPPVG